MKNSQRTTSIKKLPLVTVFGQPTSPQDLQMNPRLGSLTTAVFIELRWHKKCDIDVANAAVQNRPCSFCVRAWQS